MSLFGAIPIAGSGMDVSQTWLDAISGNLANQNDVTSVNQNAYESRFIVATPIQGDPTSQDPYSVVGQGVTVETVQYGSPAGIIAYDPQNPQANAQGLVKWPDVNTGEQLVDSVMAERGYQADVAVVNRAKSAYQSALTIGH